MTFRPTGQSAQGRFEPLRDNDSLMAFIGDIGIRWDGNLVMLRVRLKDGALNPLGILHGGALAALFDVAMYEAASADGEAVTVAQETKFFGAIYSDAPLYVAAEIMRKGRSAVYCTARALQNDKLRGYASAQFARLENAQA